MSPATLAIAASFLFVVWLLTLPRFGFLRLAIATFLIAAVVAPFPILLWSSNAPLHTGITYTSPSLTTYAVAIVLLLAALLPGWKRSSWLFAYSSAVIAYLCVGLLAVWSGVEAQWAGALHWAVAVMAMIAGYQFGGQITADVYRFVVVIIFALFTVNGVFCALQLVGMPVTLFPGELSDSLESGRPIGTFGHPSTLGKFVLLMLVLLFPALRSRDSVSRRLAWWCLAIAVPIVAVTLARANLAAVAAAIGLWLIFDRRSWARNSKRVLMLVLVAMVSAPVVGDTLQRFSTDPGGGDRANIYRAALKQLHTNLWAGTGPNYYTEVVGRWDKMTAWGFPLHNTFLHPVAELGLIGGVLFTLPVFVVGAIAIADCVAKGPTSLFSKAYLVTAPGILAIAMTGWGMLLGSMLSLWYFTIGVCAGAILHNPLEAFLPDGGDRLMANKRSTGPRHDHWVSEVK